MKKLRIRDKIDYLKVVDPYYETICEAYLTKESYAKNAKVTLNEMVHAWNCSFGRGVDVLTGASPKLTAIVNPSPKLVFIVHGREFNSLDAVQTYAHSLHLRILLTQTAIDSNIYLVTLTK